MRAAIWARVASKGLNLQDVMCERPSNLSRYQYYKLPYSRNPISSKFQHDEF